MRETDDLAFVRRAHSDRDVFDALFDRYADRVHRLAAGRSGTAGEAEDLAARMLERVFGELEQYCGRLSLDAWVLSRCKAVLSERASDHALPAGESTPLSA